MSDEELGQVAHILRRTTFGPFPGAAEAALREAGSPAAVLERVLAAEPVPFVPPIPIDRPSDMADTPTLGSPALVRWWLDRMCSDEAGLHERMMWFWHSHFTTNSSKANYLFLWHQLRKIHRHALGNFRTLAKELVVDPAMLQWLDGVDSKIDAPNENLGRELMELFTLGIGNYTEDDVRAAARGLSGWTVDNQQNVSRFHPHLGPSEPDLFLGRTAVWSPDALIDQILEQPVAAPFIVGKLWTYLIGGPRDDELIAQWADQLRAGDWEIAPLVATMVRSDAFVRAAFSRVRGSLEWATATLRVLGVDTADFNAAEINGLGQVPYDPPNVAGWTDEAGWVSSASMFARTEFVVAVSASRPGTTRPTLPQEEIVDAALARASLFEVSDATRAGLDQLAADLPDDPSVRSLGLLSAAVMTPEFALA